MSILYNRARSPFLEASMNFAYLTVLESNLFALLRVSYTIYRRESTKPGYGQKNWSEIRIRDTRVFRLRFRCEWKSESMVGVLQNHTRELLL